MAVVILGDTDFKEHELVAQAVEDRGEEAYLVDVRRWPGDDPAEFSIASGECIFGEPIPFEDVTGVFSMLQSVFPTFLPEYDWFDEKPERVAYKQLVEWQRLFYSMLAAFEAHGARAAVSPTDAYWNFHRPWMLELYHENDVPVPETTFTNDPDRVVEFVEKHSKAIVQGVNGGWTPELIHPSDLDPERLEKLAAAPIKLQEYAPGTDTRAFVVDGTFAGMVQYEYDPEAISFKSAEVKYSELDSTPIDPDAELREAVVRAGELSPSAYATVDVRLTEDGEFTILESNTPGRFAAHDLAGWTDVSGRLAEFLLES